MLTQAGLAEHLTLTGATQPTFVSATPHRFTDASVVSLQMVDAISILNLNNRRNLEQRLGVRTNPARFRVNLEIAGLPPGWELESIGSTLHAGGVSLRHIKRTKRCAVTEDTARRDLMLPYLL